MSNISGNASALGRQVDYPVPDDAVLVVDVRIVHMPADARLALDLVTGLSPLGNVVAIDMRPALMVPRSTTVYNVAARLASSWLGAPGGGRVILIGLGRVGGALAQSLAAELLGRDEPLEVVLLLDMAQAHADVAKPTDDRGALAWSEPLVVWNQQEDVRRIKSFKPDGLSDALAWLREQITQSAATALDPPMPSGLLALRSSGGKAGQAYCIPGAGASVVSFLDLAQAAPADLDIYGLQPRGLDGTCPPYATVQAAAAALEALIVEQLDERPFHLVGHSFGGCVAFELACRLHAKGLPPASLSLIDTRPPLSSPLPDDVDDVDLVLGWIRLNELAIERSMGIAKDDLQVGDLLHNLAVVHRGMVRVGLLPSKTSSSILLGPMRMFAACVRSWYHTTTLYPAPLRLVYLDDPLLDLAGNAHIAAASRAAWGALTPKLECRRAAGNHITGLKTPHAVGLSALLGWSGATC